MKKGFNQIDLIVAITLIIIVFAFTVTYMNNFITIPYTTLSSSRLTAIAENLDKTSFKSFSIPHDWSSGEKVVRPSLASYIYEVPILLEEYNGLNNQNEVVLVHLEPNERAYNTTVIVYEGNKNLETDITNLVDSDSDGFLEELDVLFRVNVPANGEKFVFVYYTEDSNVSVSYSSLTETSHTLNTTVFQEEKIKGLAPTKMNALNNLNFSYVKEAFCTERNFYLEVWEDNQKVWDFGYTAPSKGNVLGHSSRILYQNQTGHLKTVEAVVKVW